MANREDNIEALLKLWPILAFIVMLIGSYFTVKVNMASHAEALTKIRDSQSKMWERIASQGERISRLEGKF